MKKRRILLALLALALAVTTVLPAAMAYFTTNARASGTNQLKLEYTTTIEEEFANWQKTIHIAATGDSQPMWVRARAYSSYKLEYTQGTNGGWDLSQLDEKGDGWCYYTVPLASYTDSLPDGMEEEAEPLIVKINVDKIPVDQDPESFEVPVVYEVAPVQYDTAGKLVPYTEATIWMTSLEPASQGGGNAG